VTAISPAVIAIITTIGSLAVPPVVSLLKRENWDPAIKHLICGVLSLGVSALALWIVEPADFGLPLLTLGGLIYAGSQIVYQAYFKNSTAETLLARVGNKPKEAQQ
jgi:hypothetical protein